MGERESRILGAYAFPRNIATHETHDPAAGASA